MGQAYTPGLLVQERVAIKKIRELPLAGRALVKIGDQVQADTDILQAELPGEIDVVTLAERLGIEPEEVSKLITLKVGDSVSKGDVLLKAKFFFGLFQSQVNSRVTGIVEFYTPSNAHLGIRQTSQAISLKAFIPGVVTDIEASRAVEIRCSGTLIQGAFGVGKERVGTVFPLEVGRNEVVTDSLIESIANLPKNSVIVGGARFTSDALNAAAKRGAVGVTTGSIQSHDLHAFIGYEVGVSMTGDEEIPLSLVVTEGFGHLAISERITQIAKKNAGRNCSLSGATQVRAGAIRPELIIPHEEHENIQALSALELRNGARVRCIRTPYFGRFGTITELPHDPVSVESGAVLRVAKIKLESLQPDSDNQLTEVLVPRANLELVND